MSSGNLTADRRFAYARMLQQEGDAAAAADVIAQALDLAPAWPEGHFALGEARALATDGPGAVAAYHAYLDLDPTDSMGAGARIALLEHRSPAELPPAYVRRLFDEYAPRFDGALRERLQYRAPEKLRAAVAALEPGRKYAAVLDLGCGTGLAGAAFRDISGDLAGVDLSPAMVAAADRKGIYDRLDVGDMIATLRASTRPFDLVIAADVLVYVGDLAPLFAAVRDATVAGALFAFTVQRRDGADFALGPEQRYSHSAAYLRAVTQDFDVVRLDEGVFRQEKGVDVPGLLAIFRRR